MKLTLIRPCDTIKVRGIKEIIINECANTIVLIGYDGTQTVINPPGTGDNGNNDTPPAEEDNSNQYNGDEQNYNVSYGGYNGSGNDGINTGHLDEEPVETFPMVVDLRIDPIRQGTFGYDYMARVVNESQVGFNMPTGRECLANGGGWETSGVFTLDVKKNPSGYYKVRFGCHINPITMADLDDTRSQVNVIPYNENISISEDGIDTTSDWTTEEISGLLVYSKVFTNVEILPAFILKNY